MAGTTFQRAFNPNLVPSATLPGEAINLAQLDAKGVVSVKDVQFAGGAVGDGWQVDGTASITSGAATLTLTGAAFLTKAKVGHTICVPGAGVSGGPLISTIRTITDDTHVVLAGNAGTTLSAVSNTRVSWGTDDTAALLAAAAVWNSGRAVEQPAGFYLHTADIVLTGNAGQRWYGEGHGTSVLMPIGAGVNGLKLSGTLWRGIIENISISGDKHTGHAIYADANTLVYDSVFRQIQADSGDNCVDISSHFSHTIDMVMVSSWTGHGFRLRGGNTVKLHRCYAQYIRTAWKVGYRIAGDATLERCNGLNQGDIWGAWGAIAASQNTGGGTGACQSGSTTTTVKLAAGQVADAVELELQYVTFTSGLNSGLKRIITACNSGTNFITVSPALPNAPVAGDTYQVDDGDFGVTVYPVIKLRECNLEDYAQWGDIYYNQHFNSLTEFCSYLSKNAAVQGHCLYYQGYSPAGHTGLRQHNQYLPKGGGTIAYPKNVVSKYHSAALTMIGEVENGVYMRDQAASVIQSYIDYSGVASPNYPTTDPADGVSFFNSNGVVVKSNFTGLLQFEGLALHGATAAANVLAFATLGTIKFNGTSALQGTSAYVSCLLPFYVQDTTQLRAGSGAPEGSVTAETGSFYYRTDGSVYFKQSGAGNTGWLQVPVPNISTLSSSTFTPDGHLTNLFSYTLTGAATINAPTNLITGMVYTFVFTQDGTGGRTITYNAAWKNGSATATVSATGNTLGKVCTDQFIATSATTAVRVGGTPAWA